MLTLRPATELAALIRDGELTATELLEACLARIEAVDSELGAFTHLAGDAARRVAAEVTAGDPRPFAGIPIAIKDNRPVAGMPLTNGSDLFGDYIADHDAHLVRRLRAAGFVILGKTALPEMGILPTCEPRRGGPTRNPWALDRTPGGSSGGSAAAVAAGLVPIAHGNDGGGSIRIPASCCGLVALKPARGRISTGPDGGDSFLVSDGVLTRTVADTAAALDVLAGYETGDATWAPPPGEPFAATAANPPGRLRIAFTVVPPLLAAEVDPECLRATHAAAAQLESLGHDVEAIEAPWPSEELLPDFTRAFGPGVSMGVVAGARLRGRDPQPEDVEPLTWALYERGRETSTIDHLAALDRLKGIARRIVERLDPYDALLTPALAQRPLLTGAVHGRGPDPMGNYRRSGVFTPFTAIVNVCGLPAVSLPLFQGEDGLPTAVQLVGRPVGEGPLLALAAQLEAALPWSHRRPPITEPPDRQGVEQ